jgi:1-acyl-sn-glycerol-3-phosphate acyltransferase
MLPPTPIRRLLLVPLVIVIAVALAALTPPVALLSAVLSLIRRPTRPGRVRRSRLLRVIFLGLAWSAGETAVLTVFLGLWLASGFGGRLDTEPYQTRHYAVMKWFLDLIYRAAGRACGLTVTVTGPPDAGSADGPPDAGSADGPPDAGSADGPPDAGSADGRPLIVLSRHAGPGDSLLLVHYLLSVCERRPCVVMKATLQLDPSVDILANRLPNAFLRRAKAKAEEARSRTSPGFRTAAGGTHHVEQIRRLAAGMKGRSALVLFPEGGNWTPVRWRRAINRLLRGGRPDLAERAAAMPNVLPPHASGALAAIAACPAADVIFVAHTGLDRLVSVRDVWQSLLTDMEIRAHWWHVPAPSVPRAASRDAQLTWLYDWWEQIDAWITAENPAPDPEAADPEAADPEAAQVTTLRS